jgi:hypothetical protein
MNDTIKPLWEQATSSVWPRPGKFTAGEYDYHLEEFAKLVILEAADVLNKWKSEPFPYDSEFGANLIKQHFGVK